jgi:hypothetical protein
MKQRVRTASAWRSITMEAPSSAGSSSGGSAPCRASSSRPLSALQSAGPRARLRPDRSRRARHRSGRHGRRAPAGRPTRCGGRSTHSSRTTSGSPTPRWCPDFHPRYDALGRSYVYRVGLRQHGLALSMRWCWPCSAGGPTGHGARRPRRCWGDHSFRAFAKAGRRSAATAASSPRPLGQLESTSGLEFHISANRFLHHMVRYLVGTVVAVGLGDRRRHGCRGSWPASRGFSPPRPRRPEGSFLRSVDYPRRRRARL